MKLSNNFSLAEFEKSDTADTYGIPNRVIDNDKIENIKHLCTNVLEPIRKQMGNRKIYITSGYRCPELNRIVGGSPTSHHKCEGGFAAADFVMDGREPRDIIDFLRGFYIPFEQVIMYPDFIHISAKIPGREFYESGPVINGMTINIKPLFEGQI